MTAKLLTVPDLDSVSLLDEAHRLAEKLSNFGDESVSVIAVVFDGIVDLDSVIAGDPDEIVHVIREDGEFTTGAAGVQARATALVEIVKQPYAVLLPDTADGVDLAAATAGRLRGGCVTDCLLRVRDGDLLAGRQVYGGRAYAELSIEDRPPIVTLNTEAIGTPSEPPENSPSKQTVEITIEEQDEIRHIENRDVPEEDLAKARRIVAGGFGLGGADGFDIIEDLADALDAAVGASRPPSDEGWVPYSRQIGVTGKEIDTELYVPGAISGDSYHMRSVNAEFLIPINSDPDARIFNFADIGIVGDIYEYGPELADAVRQAKSSRDHDAEEVSK